MILKTTTAIIVAGFVSSLAIAQTTKTSMKRTTKPAAVKAEDVADWSAHAVSELEAARSEVPVLKDEKGAPIKGAQPTAPATSDALPTPATIRAEVTGVDSVIERTALRFTFLFEPYQPHGIGRFGASEQVNYSNLPSTVLGQVDLRWLPFEIGDISGKPVTLGGYGAFGYSRQKIPLVAPSGFRYDDVALNTLRYEAGVAAGVSLSNAWNIEARFGAGRLSAIQTSKYSDVVGTFERPYAVAALDAVYHVFPRFAVVGSVAHRSPLSDGTGSIAFDPVTVSGGFLVQVR